MNLLLSSQKYGTSYDEWYNWYIVYTTILAYNDSILFRACQGLKQKEGQLRIPGQIVRKGDPL